MAPESSAFHDPETVRTPLAPGTRRSTDTLPVVRSQVKEPLTSRSRTSLTPVRVNRTRVPPV